MPAKGASVHAAIGRLQVITDTRQGKEPLSVVDAALAAGAEVIQVRAKGWTDRALFELAGEVARRCAAKGATCLVDDRVDVALAVGAAGVHVGDADLPVEAVRRVAGDRLVIGATVRDPAAARAAARAGASYLGVGPCFATSTKDGLPPVLGPAGLAEVAVATELPVVAIGGIDASRIGEVIGAGAHGVAVVAAVSEAVDPGAAVAGLLAAIDAAVRAGGGAAGRDDAKGAKVDR